MKQKLVLPLEIKDVTAEGKFTGMASVYGETDLGGDVVERGAFAKTIGDNPTIPVLWQHKSEEVIGSGSLRNTRDGLAIDGQLDMEDPVAVKAYRKLKLGLMKGLSIGFDSIQDEIKNGVRHLKEIRLWEVSIVTFPMLTTATVTSVKQMVDSHKADFATTLEAAQTWAARSMMQCALSDSLSSIVWGDDTPENKVAAAEESINQFSTAYLEALPKFLALLEADTGMYYNSIANFEKKEGRELAATHVRLIEAATTNLQARLAKAAAGTLHDDAAAPGAGTGDPSALVAKIQLLKESLQWSSISS